MPPIPLTVGDLAVAGLLLLINGGLSVALSLGLERTLVLAAARMVAQLSLVGLVLKQLFALQSPWLTLAAALVMVLFAGHEALARQERRLAGGWSYGLGTGAIGGATSLVMLLALLTAIRPAPWWDARYAIPLLGMVLGNALSGVSLALNTLTAAAVRERAAIEARLALGGTRWEAMQPLLRHALRTGLMPTINAMAVTGLVSLPGMMTGQILAGSDPGEAVKYQILIMFLISGATGLGVLAATLGAVRRLTDARHRLRLDRLGGARR
ncbi:ABC transporter permease [Azospirillum thermophilum]|uniref:Iron export ABC transporter permease subunit FetB n=1 Tax=Azospirillum thermophilum TaxID=2202148 RepID=A0A2S2CMA2_9PROT|nr:iron export ABC transporter permease subunit FetB [Azospirillum thermophilum]AWK85643.1 iron export ABC transporter permease subunit FetB [Azospirillum thermophilum]